MSEAKVALITGGSRGIGKACAEKFAKDGYDVAFTYAGNEEAAKKTIEELSAYGHKVAAYKFDVSNFEETSENVQKIIEEFGRVDVLVNNAGITKDNLFLRMSAEDWNKVINTNLTGVFNVSKPVVKVMMKQRSGAIINMSSIAGVCGNAGQANYSSAKAGLIGFTKSLAKELGSRNIRVNAVAPGLIMTDMTKGLDGEKIAEAIPLKRLGTVEDISSTVKFLADGNSYITGQVIGIDGGLTI